MIASLNGHIADKVGELVVIDCGGVGYGIHMTVEDQGALSSGSQVKVFVYEHIRENSYDLFGFTTPDTKKMFELLLGVNGVGPKMALSILSIANLSSVKQAIAAGDTKFISRANGVGKRVAERVVVDLKDKVGLVSSGDATDFLGGNLPESADEAVQGLVSLGFSAVDAQTALKDVDNNLSSEQRIKLALKNRF